MVYEFFNNTVKLNKITRGIDVMNHNIELIFRKNAYIYT